MTALGVMARAPVAGACKTRLGRAIGAHEAADLYRAMLVDSLTLFRRVGAERCVVMAAPEDDGPRALRDLAPSGWQIIAQEGAGLGARLAHAFQVLGGSGAPAVLVDSDSPTVDPHAIGAALARFHGPRRALIGPCEDGGYYLIGLTTLELGILDGIAWSTPEVAAQTRARCAALGLALEELPLGYDVDTAEDVARLRAELARHPERARETAALLCGRNGARA
jgi:rSAM/selenodomain-associated transferase 1